MVHCINPCLCSLSVNFPILRKTSRYYPPPFLFTLFYSSYYLFCVLFCNALYPYLIILLHDLPLDAYSASLNLVSFLSVTYVYSTQFLFLSNWSLGCTESKQSTRIELKIELLLLIYCLIFSE